jgi:hypothetical protein
MTLLGAQPLRYIHSCFGCMAGLGMAVTAAQQHKAVERLRRRRLQDEAATWAQQYKAQPPSACIIFILGGSTYEEAKLVAEWNAKQQQAAPSGQQPMRVILGGTAVLNTDAFLEALGAGARRQTGTGDAVINVR